MAQRTLTLLVCDLCDDNKEGSETIEFALDGRNYEIDVCPLHSAELRDGLARYVGAARRSAGARRGRRGSRATSPDRERVAEIRAWARKTGLKVSERGRVAGTIVEQYEAAHR